MDSVSPVGTGPADSGRVPTRGRKVVLAAAVGVAMGAVLITLSSSGLHRTGTNNVPGVEEVAQLRPSQSRCQEVDVPRRTDQLAVAAASDAGAVPALAVVLSVGTRALALGRTRETAPDGRPLVNLRPIPPAGPARVCVRNAGRHGIALLGISDTFGVDYYEGRQTWWDTAPALAQRFGFGKAGFVGAWTFWMALALVAGAMIASWRALALAESRA